MKLDIENDGAALLLRAETPADLDFLERMKGVHGPGPWAHAEIIRIPVEELGFDPAGMGMSWIGKDGLISKTLAGVRLRTDWLTCREPPSPERKALLEAQQAVGQAFYQLQRLLPIKAELDLAQAAARVAAVKGNS